MEKRNGGASSKGVLEPVTEGSDVFNQNILNPLQSSYLYEESKQNFTYKSAFLIRSPAVEEKYNAFRAKRREAGYSEEELKESYGFLLFDDENKANLLGETGVLAGNSTCTTLGDPSKGVYMSMYSDCLDQNRWYHGKSGCIAIIRVTKGRVKKVFENYTQNFTEPSVGFDCHVSEQLSSVSAQTSSFLAFERTQYYLYELLHAENNETAQSPSLACPFAIVSFSYTDTKGTFVEPQEIREQKIMGRHFSLWKGQLQVGTQFYHVDLRSTAGAFIPAKLPTVVKVDRAISMTGVRQLLPRAVFESCFFEEVFMDGLYCSLCELVSSVTEEMASFSLLLQELKEKDLGLTVPLNDSGFLMLLHSSHFMTFDDAGCTAEEVLQGIFVFPDSRLIQRDTKFGQSKPAISPEALRIIPALGYAEGEVEKTPPDQTDELCNVLVQHMQSYAALINPGMASSPSREISIFPDQYDVPDAHKNLYTAPRWTNRSWQSFRSYVNKPVSFQLPVCVASEILAAGQQDKTEDHDDDVYIDLSSPEGAPASPVIMETEDQLTGHKSPPHVETGDSCAEAKLDSFVLPQSIVPVDQQPGTAALDTEKLDFLKLGDTVLIEADELSVPPTPDDIPAELIVSITSAERTTETHKSLGVISAISATKDNDIQLSSSPSGDLQMVGLMPNPTKNQQRTLHKVQSKGHTKATKSSVQASSLQTEDGNSTCWEHDQTQKTSGHSNLKKSTNTGWRKFPKCRRKYGKLSSKRKKVCCAPRVLTITEEKKTHPRKHGVSVISTNDEPSFLLKKLDLWELKPVFTTCGRVLVPHGYVDTGDEIKSSKDEQQPTSDEQCPGNIPVDASVKAHDTIEMKQQFNAAPETTVDDAKSWDGGKDPQNTVVNSENSDSRESYVGKSSVTCKPQGDHSLHNDGTDMLPSGEVQEKQTDTLSPGKIVKKSDFFLSKLSVLLRGKRKTLHDISEDASSNTEPPLKKGGFDSDIETLAGNEVTESALDANENVEEVSEMQVDTDSAHALCLTHKDVPNEMQKAEGQDTRLKRALSETQEPAILDSEPQPLQSPTSSFQRKYRVKMLKKQQDIPEEDIKKKWWLHFPTVSSNETDKLKACMSEFSVRKTLEKQKLAACTSTDALNLLADLALGATTEQVPQQPHPTLERKPSSLEICGLTKDTYNTEQESVLHDLLRQPAASASPNLPFESSSTRRDLIESVSKEHNYSLLPSSSLPLDVPGTTLQESPVFCSSRLQCHHLENYSDMVQLASDGLEDRNGHNNRTPESTKKHMMGKRKFQHSHAFQNKDGFIQVTREWKENYDFNLDSKFTNDAMDKTISRALHGPWDFTIQDSREEVQLIVHMWIGLFYSRSTARFFQVDANFTYLCSEENESLDTTSGMVPAPAVSDQKTTSSTSSPSIIQETSVSKALDLSKKDAPVLNEGPTILDLSLRNANAFIDSSAPQVDGKEPTLSSATLNASVGLNKGSTSHLHQAKSHESCGDLAHITNLRDTNDDDTRSTYQDKSTCPSQKIGYMEDSDALSIRDHGTSFPSHKWKKREPILSENVMSTLGNAHITHGPNTDGTGVRDFENPATTAISLVQKPRTESSEAIKYKEVDSNNETDNGVQADVENCKLIEQPNQAGCHTLLKTSDDSTNKESVMVCSEKPLETDSLLSNKRPKVDSLVQPKKRKKDFTVAFEEDGFVPPVDAGSSLSTQQLPTSDRCDPNKNFITESDAHTTLDQHPCRAESDKDACSDLQPSVECTNDNASTVKHTISEGVQHATSHQEPIRFKFVKKVNIKTYEAKCKKAELSMSHENPRSSVRSRSNVAQSKPRTESSEAIACKGIDSNNEADNGLHVNLENCKLIEQPNQAGCSTVLETSDGAKNEESVMVCNEKPLETDSLLSKEGPKVDSLGQPKKLKKDFIIAFEEDSFVPPVDSSSSLSKQQLPTSDCRDPNKSFITESDPHTTLDEHPCLAESGKDACSDLQLSMECTDDSASTVKHSISEKVEHVTSHQEPICSEFVNELNIKTYEANCNKTTLSMSHENTRSSVGSRSNVAQSKPRTESSEAIACKGIDSNNEADNGLHVNLENCKLIEQPNQAGCPTVLETSDGAKNEESVMLCNEKPLETDSLLSKEGPKVDSLGQPKKLKKDLIIAFEEDSFVPPVDTGSSLRKQQLPTSDRRDPNKSFITESDPHTTLDQHPCLAESGKDACSDLQLSMECTDDSASTVKHSISEKVEHAPSQQEPIRSEFVNELNITTYEANCNKTTLSMSHENTRSSVGSRSNVAQSKPRTESSEAIACKGIDSNNEADNGLHVDLENCKLIEQPNQAGCPTVLETSDGAKNEESVMLCNEKPLETDILLSKEGPKVDSLGQPKKLKKDFIIAFEEDSFVPPVDSSSSLSKQQLPTSDQHDPNKSFITESDPHTTLDQHPCLAESGKDACSDLRLSMECTDDIASTVKHSISEKVEHVTSHQEPICSEFVNELNFKTYEANCNKTTLSMSHENTRSSVGSRSNVAQSKPRTESSEAIAWKGIDSNNEADNGLHVNLENCKLIEQPNQAGCPTVLETSDYSTSEESVMFCNEIPLETDCQLSKEGTKVDSLGQPKKLKKDFIIAFEEDSFVPPVDTGSSLSKQQLPTSDRRDPNKSFITESDPHTTLDQHPCLAESGKDACSDLQLSMECTDDSASTVKHSISEKVKHAPSQQEPIRSEFVNELNIKIYEANCNKTTLSMSHKNTRSSVGSRSNVAESKPRTESSEAIACKGIDSNNEADNGLHVDLENRKLIEQLNQAGCPTVLETSDYSTNKESVMVCNEKPLEPLSLLSKEGPKADSLGQPKKHKKDFTITFEEDSFVAPVDTSSSLSTQQLPTSDFHDPNKKNLFTESDHHTTLDEHPCQPDSGNDAYSDLQLSMECTNDSASTDKHTISERVEHAPSHREHMHSEFVNELNNIYSLKRAFCKKAALLRRENTGSSVWSCASVSQSDSSDERESPNMATKKYIVRSSRDDEDRDAKLTEEEENSSKREQSEGHFQCSVSKKCKDVDPSTKEMNAENYRTEELEKIDNRVIIPFIGMEAPENDMIYPRVPWLQDKFKESAQNQQEIPFICETTSNECSLPIDMGSASQPCHESTEELFAKIPFFDAHEDKHVCSVNEPDARCPTPTVDEKPFEDSPYSATCGSTASHSCHEDCKNRHKDPIRRSSGEDVMVLAQEHCQTSTFDSDPHLDPDHVLRTQRVLRCLQEYLSTNIDTFSQNETADRNVFSDQDPDPNRKCITTSLGSSHISDNSGKKKLHDVKQGVVSASTMEQEHTPLSSSSLHQLKSCFKDNFKEVLKTKLQFIEAGPSVGQQYSKTTDKSQSRLSHEPLSYSQRPILAVKPSKSKERQANISYINNKASPATFSKNFFESVKTPSNTGSTHMPCSVENIWQKTEETLELSENDDLDLESTPPLDYNSFILGCQSSLKCTVDNSSRKRSLSFLEEMSQRCLQHDMTESSLNHETLIFSEQMKQLLKRSKRGSSCNRSGDGKSKLSCCSPLTVQISCQEDQQDLAHMDDLPMSLRHKAKVDLSDLKCLFNTTEENQTLHTPQLFCRMEKPVKSVDMSGITAEYASIYEDMMNITCAGKVLPSKSKTLQKERNRPLAGPSNRIDFSEQTTMEMLDSILSLSSVVKQSSKVKHRFYIFATSEDAFFEETKAHLEAEGHIAVDPSQFFLDEISSTCLLIIVRNEDIAEHIFEVPHLLELKKSPNALFAGIDEPDDIVNLTYQELFKRGGFMMFDRAALESLSFRNMEKLSEILYELNKTGKWKWMLHYRDSRQLKENARMSTEAKKKKHFTQWCQEAGILEVLPYHECDIASRDRPDYLTCLVHLQIQNISSRFTVFLTDKNDDTFARCGILTMTVNSLLTVSPSEMFHL